jgi:CRISPR-associated protein Cmr6
MIPLYKDSNITKSVRINDFVSAHHGLWFERFFNQYSDNFDVEKTAKSGFLSKLVGPDQAPKQCGEATLLESHCLRQRLLIEAQSGQFISRQSNWHMAVGMGNPHPVENSLFWHPTLGVPYLPASSVKGLLRAWLELGQMPKDGLHRLFGSDHKNPAEQTLEQQAGELIFFDALPVQPVTLVVDIMAPHMGKWYTQGATNPNQRETLPADWHDPIPVTFLAAKNLLLQVGVAPRKRAEDSEELVTFAINALSDALLNLGAGSKTASGYGHFQKPDSKHSAVVDRFSESIAKAQKHAAQQATEASWTDSQRLSKKLLNAGEDPRNYIAGSQYHNDLEMALKDAVDWPADERRLLATFAKSFFKQHGSKKRIKQVSPLITSLLEG